MANTPTKSASGGSIPERVAGTVGDSLSARANQVTEKVSDVAKSAADTIDARRSTAADGLQTAASTLHDKADNLPGGETVKEFAHAAADRLTTTADYVRQHDVNRMMSDVETLVKNNPGPSLLAAAVFGFFVGRALSHD
jgi:ElaB/YqjD/DUF883 family membrane-anchored ribosome-binding protein